MNEDKVSFLGINYSVLVKEQEGYFYILCRGLNLVTEGADLPSAYAEMQVLRQKTLERFKKMGLPPPEPLNEDLIRSQSGFFKKKKFSSVKMIGIIVVCILFLASSIIVPIVTTINRVSQSFERVRNLSDNHSTLPKLLISIANTLQNVTPQRKQEMHESLKIIIDEVKPFADDVRPLLFDRRDSDVSMSKKEGDLPIQRLENDSPANSENTEQK